MHQFRTRSHLAILTAIINLAACGNAPINAQEAPTSVYAGNSNTPAMTSGPAATSDPSNANDVGGNANTPAATGNATFTVTATGFVPHAGQNFFAAIVDANNHRLADANVVVPADGNFDLSFDNLAADALAGGNARLVYYADVNKNGFCNTTPTDHSWEVAIATDDTTASIAHNENFTAVCEGFGQYGLTFHGTGFTPHVGQTFYIDIIDNEDKTEVGEIKHMTIPASANVTEAWGPLLLAGHSYTVAYFADVNKNQTCDNLGADHAWVKNVTNVAADVVVAGKHSDAQVKSVCTNFPTGKLPQ